MIWGVYRDGLIYPSGPVPPDWSNGQRVTVEPEHEPSDDPAEIDRWEVQWRQVGPLKYDPGEQERAQAAMEEADRLAKDEIRRQMGLDR
jgi:hypothetical protein